MQLITEVERRRRWSDEQKRAIVAAAFAPGAVVTEVARRADINSGQIYWWRRDLRVGSSEFAEVVISSFSRSPGILPSVIDVALSDGARVHIPTLTPPKLAVAVLTALVRQ